MKQSKLLLIYGILIIGMSIYMIMITNKSDLLLLYISYTDMGMGVLITIASRFKIW